MLIYEVSITIDPSVMSEYTQWMSEEHIPEVMRSPGFVKAEFLLEPEGRPRMRVLYYIKDATFLKKYLSDYAPALRQKSLDRWKDHFQAERAIWALYGTVQSPTK